MTIVDLIYHFRQDVMPIAVPLCVVVGAGLLWRRTRRAAAMVQLVGATLILYGMVVNQFWWHSNGLDAVRSEAARISMDVALLLGCLLFPVSYLLYAVRQMRI